MQIHGLFGRDYRNTIIPKRVLRDCGYRFHLLISSMHVDQISWLLKLCEYSTYLCELTFINSVNIKLIHFPIKLDNQNNCPLKEIRNYYRHNYYTKSRV